MTMTSIVRWLLWLMLAFSPMTALAQSYMTTVTAQVKDINGTLYNSCRYSATLVNLSTSTLTLGGTALPDQFKQVTGTQCDANGRLSTNVVANTAMIPNNSQWRFTICDNTGANCFNVQTTISGITLDITTQIQAAAVILPITNTTLLAGNNVFRGSNTFLSGVGIMQLSIPTAPTVTPTCTGTCATTYSYQVTTRDLVGETQPTASVNTSNAPTLDNTNFNTIATPVVVGALSCGVYRTGGGVNQGFIGTVTCGSSLVDNGLNSCTGSCSSPYIAPTQNTTGGVGAHLPVTVFMGDSRTRGITFTLTNLFPNQPWINRGRGGDKCADEDGRFAAEVVALHPQAVLINCGTNDFWNTTGTPASGATFTTAENAITDMVTQALAAGIAPIVSTVPPVRPGVSQPIVAQMNTDLVTFNTWIKTSLTAPYGGIRIIDLYGAVVDLTGQLPAEITTDGVHFNDSVGNPLLAGFIRSYLPNPGVGSTFFGERSILNASQLNGGYCVYNFGAPNLANYEKGCLVVNSNGYDLTAIAVGTGALRPIRLKGSFVSLGTPSVTWWLTDGSNLRPAADNTYDLGVVATNRIKRTYTLQLNSGQAANSDLDGTLTAVANSASLTFAGAYSSHPICIANDETTVTSAIKVTYTGNTSVTFTTPGATDVIDYICHGRN